LPGVGVVKIFYDSDSSGLKSFRLLGSDSTALESIHTVSKQGIKGPDIMVNLVWANTILGV